VWATVRRRKPSTNRLPTLFPALDAVLHGHTQGIAEYQARFLEAHAVLAPVGQIPGIVPLEADSVHAIIIIIYL
jgi:hypothetical protein